ncbi:MAG TPA: hypothetical protein VN959_11300 [Mycobacterium sp.]|nr:hypothetical protein [Mycobacterium sp.]
MPTNFSQIAAKGPTVDVSTLTAPESVRKRDLKTAHRPHHGGYGR